MTIPARAERIAYEISATVSKDDRAALVSYLEGVETSEELFKRCLNKAVRALNRYNARDIEWLKRWLPIIFKTISESQA